jgi:hypothetical protein
MEFGDGTADILSRALEGDRTRANVSIEKATPAGLEPAIQCLEDRTLGACPEALVRARLPPNGDQSVAHGGKMLGR